MSSEQFLEILPGALPTARLHAYLLAGVAPRPIAFASTLDKEGRPNLAPFSFFNVFGSRPPLAIFSPARRVRDNTTKDTLENVKEVPEVVINAVNFAMVNQCSLASTEYPRGVNEFLKAGLTPIPSDLVRPFGVAESPFRMECKVREVIETGTEGGAGNLIVCEILKIHIRQDVLDSEGQIDQHKIDLVARLGKDWYCRASGASLFEVEKPLARLGVGIDSLPESVRTSPILTGNELARLGNVPQLPSPEAVSEFVGSGRLEELAARLGYSPGEMAVRAHEAASKLLAENHVEEALLLLMATAREVLSDKTV
ncbi:MAG: flavin reductase family protein [Flavobacteriales bacterium]|nr:flavin reductase family protein [Flavobacteriales bacterium]MCX7649808.1 flavin reductase family protein [Flavobacteriales bacterium]MDW8431563.1 flavin reductase family protein [Flavobacteriales bacterium]